MPETFHIRDMSWVDGRCPVDKDGESLPWFVKENEGNKGSFVQCCEVASQCMSLVRPGINYVVQQHVRDQMLIEGCKFHIRCQVLLTCESDGATWRVYVFNDGYLNISPNQWDPVDMSRDTQIVIYRSRRTGDWEPWRDVYPKCKASVEQVIEQAVLQGQLEGRLGKAQFEIASWDYMVDTHGNVWLLEVNMGPVFRDKFTDPDLNDDEMLTMAFEIIVPRENPPNLQKWEFVSAIIGTPPPQPMESPAAAPVEEKPAVVNVVEEPLDEEVADGLAAFLDSLA